MRASRWRIPLIAVGVALTGSPVAHGQPEFCLRDADHDGHPMFGNPQVRTGFEMYNEQNYVAQAFAIAFGDLDGDGDADALAVNNKEWAPPQYYLSVHLNHGDGVLDPAEIAYPVGAGGVDVAVGDLDGDGHLDAATANAQAHTVSILPNQGDATFAPHVEYPVGQGPRSLWIADLEGDGDLDLCVLNVTSDDVSVLRNKGDGTFAPEVRVFVGSVTPNDDLPGPFLAVGDLDGDGDADMAVPCFAKVKVLLNDGAGAFMLAPVHPSVATPDAHAVAIADLDGDADNDLAVTSVHGGGATYNPNILSIILNTGGGSFAAPVAYNAGTTAFPQYAASISAGDIDADLDIDLVVGHGDGGRVMLMRNLGAGAFAPKEEVRVFHRPWFVRFAELNGDNRLDLPVLTVQSRSKLCVLLNNGAGSVITAARYPPTGGAAAQSWSWLETADLDGDGDLDLVVSSNGSAPFDVLVMLNDGSGVFSIIHSFALAPSAIPAAGESVSIGDLNADGSPDLVVCDAIVPGGFDQSGKVWTTMGHGDGTFDAATPYPLSGLFPKASAIADFDGDSDRDLAVWAIQVYPGNDLTPVDRRVLILSNTLGSFAPAAQHTIAALPWPFPLGEVVAVDLDTDGDPDLAATAGTGDGPGMLVTLSNDGRGNFVAAQAVISPPVPHSLRPLDLDSDGHIDLAVMHAPLNGLESQPYLTMWRNDGQGVLNYFGFRKDSRVIALGRMAAVPAQPGWRAALALPLNSGGVLLHTAGIPGILSERIEFGTGYWPTAVVLGDFNGDDRLDLAVTNAFDSNVSVLLNHACDGCYADCDVDGVLAITDFFCFQTKFIRLDPYADCNADAVLTVADFGCFQRKFVQGCP